MTSPVSPSETIAKAMEGVTPDRIERLWWFLHVLAKCSGTTNANDDRWNWINAFCADFPDDTFNRAAKLGLIRVSHNDLTEDSTARLTDAGNAFVSYFTEMPSTALALQLEAMQREMVELREALTEMVGIAFSVKSFCRNNSCGDYGTECPIQMGEWWESSDEEALIRARTLIQGGKK